MWRGLPPRQIEGFKIRFCTSRLVLATCDGRTRHGAIASMGMEHIILRVWMVPGTTY